MYLFDESRCRILAGVHDLKCGDLLVIICCCLFDCSLMLNLSNREETDPNASKGNGHNMDSGLIR
jgi:hypothetical protein